MNHHLIRFVATLIIVLSFTVAGCGGGGDDDNAAGSASAPTPSAAKTLAIAPIAQQSPVWCWAASAQMVFTYYGLPSLSNGGFNRSTQQLDEIAPLESGIATSSLVVR